MNNEGKYFSRVEGPGDTQYPPSIRAEMKKLRLHETQPEQETPVDPNFEPSSRGTLFVRNQSATWTDVRGGLSGFEYDRPGSLDKRFNKGPFGKGPENDVFLVTKFVQRFGNEEQQAEVPLADAKEYLQSHHRATVEIKPSGDTFIGRIVKEPPVVAKTLERGSLRHLENSGYSLRLNEAEYRVIEVQNKYGEVMTMAEIGPLLLPELKITAQVWEEPVDSGKYVAKVVKAEKFKTPDQEAALTS